MKEVIGEPTMKCESLESYRNLNRDGNCNVLFLCRSVMSCITKIYEKPPAEHPVSTDQDFLAESSLPKN